MSREFVEEQLLEETENKVQGQTSWVHFVILTFQHHPVPETSREAFVHFV